jgi:hypothetical protein
MRALVGSLAAVSLQVAAFFRPVRVAAFIFGPGFIGKSKPELVADDLDKGLTFKSRSKALCLFPEMVVAGCS